MSDHKEPPKYELELQSNLAIVARMDRQIDLVNRVLAEAKTRDWAGQDCGIKASTSDLDFIKRLAAAAGLPLNQAISILQNMATSEPTYDEILAEQFQSEQIDLSSLNLGTWSPPFIISSDGKIKRVVINQNHLPITAFPKINSDLRITELYLECVAASKPNFDIDLSESTTLERLSLSMIGTSTITLPYLPLLHSFECSYCDLESLDLKQCPKLRHLTCTDLPIDELDLSSNPNLEFLDAGMLFNLRTHDFSHTPNLKFLSTFDTNPFHVDLSHLTKLEFLCCDYNGLAHLDLSRNHKLKFLSCNCNMLNILDLAHNPDLREIRCSKNQIDQLDISGLKNQQIRLEHDPNVRIVKRSDQIVVPFDKPE